MSQNESFNKALEIIHRIHAAYPSLRLCQIIGNAVPTNDSYYVENGRLVEYLLEYETKIKEITSNR